MPMIGTGRARRRRWNEKRTNPPSAPTTKIPKEMRAHSAAPGATAAIAKATRPDATKSPSRSASSTGAEHIFPKAYGPLLAHVVTVISNRLSPSILRAAMREVGRAVAADHLNRWKGRDRRERIEAALDLLHDLGGLARFDERDGKQFIYGRNGCPLAAVTASHPEACLIVESLLSKVIGAPAKKCCAYGETPRCCFELSHK